MFKQPWKYLFLWLLPLVVSANYVHWLGDYNTALHLASKKHKPLLVLVVKKTCKQCNTVIKNQFMNQSYIEKINQKTVSVIVTYEGTENYPIELYYTSIFPTLFIVESKKEVFLRDPLYGKEINTNILSGIINGL